jgi:hypothetical protein
MLSLESGTKIVRINKKGKSKGYLYYGENDQSNPKENTGKNRHIKLPDKLNFEPISRKERDVILITGMSGLGKSTFAAKIMKSYKGPVYLFSRKDYDPAYEDLDIMRIIIGPNLVKEPINPLTSFKDSLVVFDDYETIPDIRVKEAVKQIIIDIAEVGRQNKISLVVCNHVCYGKDVKFDRTLLNEVMNIVIFKGGLGPQLTRTLVNYFNMTKKQISDLYKMSGKWINISKVFPRYIYTEKECLLI